MLKKMYMNFNQIVRTANMFPHFEKKCHSSGSTTPTHVSSVTNQGTAVFLAPPLSIGSVCFVEQRGNKKRGRYGVVPLVPYTTFDNGNAKITVLMCNALNWTAWWKHG